MKKRMCCIMIVMIMFCIPIEADASVGGFLTKIGTLYRTNLSTGTVYSMSNGGAYATVGSMSLRSPDMGNPLAGLFNITVPSFHAGCSGLDLNTGGLFFITDPKILVQRLTSYGTSVVYGMLISLSSSLPIIGTALKWLRKQQTDLDKSLMSGCDMGKAIGRSMGTKISAWYDSTQQNKDTKNGAPADAAVHHNKTTPIATAFNLAAITMGGYSYETLDLIMSLTGTLIKKPGIQPGSEHGTPLGSTITVKDFMKGNMKNKKEYWCQGVNLSTPVPDWDGSDPAKPAPCVSVVKANAQMTVTVQKKFSDLIMAAIFHLRFAGLPLGGASTVGGGGVSVASLMHGYTLNELNAAINGSGSAFAATLQAVATRHDIRKLYEYLWVKRVVANPFAPYMALSYLRGVINKLYGSTLGSPNQYASNFPRDMLNDYRKSIENVALAAQQYKVDINADYASSKIFVEEFQRISKQQKEDAMQGMQVGD